MSTPIAMPEIFQSTRPIRGATNSGSITLPLSLAFQSTRPIRGATGWSGCASLHASAFQSTRPIRGATVGVLSGSSPGRDFNPRAPSGARRVIGGLVVHAVDISIHAPHTGRDFPNHGVDFPNLRISIHAPHTGRDLPHFCQGFAAVTYFNPRAPYGARLAFSTHSSA